MKMPSEPSQFAVRMAVTTASHGPCAKSKRGVAAYVAFGDDGDPIDNGEFVVACHNAPPYPISCEGTEECKTGCRQLAIHAEEAVVQSLLVREEHALWNLCDVALVHARAVDGKLVPSRGPSCVTCSKTMLYAGVGGIWLYEYPQISVELGNVPEAGEADPPARWRFYTAMEFHMETLAHLDLPLHIKAVDLPEAIRQCGGSDELAARVANKLRTKAEGLP